MAGCHWADGNKNDDGGWQTQTEGGSLLPWRQSSHKSATQGRAHREPLIRNQSEETAAERVHQIRADMSFLRIRQRHINQIENTEAKYYISVGRL